MLSHHLGGICFRFSSSLACVNFSFLSRSLFVNYNNARLGTVVVARRAQRHHCHSTFARSGPPQLHTKYLHSIRLRVAVHMAVPSRAMESTTEQIHSEEINKKISKWKHIRWITFLFFFILKSQLLFSASHLPLASSSACRIWFPQILFSHMKSVLSSYRCCLLNNFFPKFFSSSFG